MALICKKYKTNKMNTLNFKGLRSLILPLLGAIIITGCASPKKLSKNLEKMKFKPETEVIEVHGDSLRIAVKGSIPPKSFHKKAVVKFAPILRFGDPELTEEQELEPLYLQGEKVKKDKMKDGEHKGTVKVIKFAKGGSFTYKQTIAFTPMMKKSKMGMDYQVKIASSYSELDQCIVGKRDSALRGTITTSLLVKPYDDIIYYSGNTKVEDGENLNPNGNPDNLDGDAPADIIRRKKNVPDVVFYYACDEPVLRDSVNRGPAAKKLNFILSEIANKTKAGKKKGDLTIKVKGVVFKSYASPDGEFNHNTGLTKGRANSGLAYVKKEMKKYGIKEVYDKDMARVPDPMSEDWSGFKRLVEKSNIEDKAAILSIIRSNAPVEEKEKSFKALNGWPKAGTRVGRENTSTPLYKILARLRRTEVYFDAIGIESVKPVEGSGNMTETRATRSLEEIKTAYSQNDPNLSQKEMLILASSIEDMNEREKVYAKYTEAFPDDYRGKINLASIKVKNGSQTITDYRTALNSNPKIDEAEATLTQLSAQYPNNDTIKSNLAVARRFKRKYSEAADMFVMSKSKGLNESNNLAILSIKTGNYSDAVASFRPDQCDYNVALALILNKEYDKALDKIKCIVDAGKGNADVYYLKAIVYARQSIKTDMSTALTRCIQEAKKINKDGDFRDQAMKDMEFVKYMESPEFKQALK